ncbi:hypothetical protein [Larkinella terrae]|uniref:Uncharacterized protein n=1 Tax=Larkinella terrae TaxID=2025311 RepID=A0A7K0EEU2_9BACT|nr:hypothetical protein [Larkinella terrae]MRS60359.1 hypothetical protein [Larkinella terrae]
MIKGLVLSSLLALSAAGYRVETIRKAAENRPEAVSAVAKDSAAAARTVVKLLNWYKSPKGLTMDNPECNSGQGDRSQTPTPEGLTLTPIYPHWGWLGRVGSSGPRIAFGVIHSLGIIQKGGPQRSAFLYD